MRQRRTSGTTGSVLHVSISQNDPANAMWASQLQITAETYHKAPGSPQTIQTIFQKHYASSLASRAIIHNHVRHCAALFGGRYCSVVSTNSMSFTFINWPERAALDSQTMAKPHVVNKLWISFSTEHTAHCAELSGSTVNILIINSLLLIAQKSI